MGSAPATRMVTPESMTKMDTQMKTMRDMHDMHEKMMMHRMPAASAK